MSERPSARADFVSALVWIGLGGAIVHGSWTMDRLESMHINPYTAPGLVPGLLGAGLTILGVLLLVRSRSLRSAAADAASEPDRAGWQRFALALALCLGFGLGMIGRGMPFWLATLLFVFAFIVLFQLPERRARGTVVKGALLAFACAAATGLLVTLVFQEIFLVRLP